MKAAGTVLLAGLLLAQRAPQTFRSSIDIVRVDALVSEGKRPVGGLSAHDFDLWDNGVSQTIDSVAVETLPLSLTLVLDVSGSVEGDKIASLTAAVGNVLDALTRDDSATLITFSHEITLQAGPTKDFAALRRLIASSPAAGGTALIDAVYAAVAIEPPSEMRQLMIVFSDGVDNMSWLSADQAARAAQRSDAVLYGVSVPDRVKATGRVIHGRDGRLINQTVREYAPARPPSSIAWPRRRAVGCCAPT